MSENDNETAREGRRRRPSPATVQAVVVGGAFLAALAVVSALVVNHSVAAFTANTDNTANQFNAGTVVLTDDDTGTAMFNVSNMAPGQTVERCIVVTYSGSIPDPTAVRLYSGGYTDSGTLAAQLDVTIQEGSGGSFGAGDCTGFTSAATIETGGTLVDFDTDHTDYATGAGTWDPSSTPASRTYRFAVTMNAAAPDSVQGDSVTNLGFTWEVQS